MMSYYQLINELTQFVPREYREDPSFRRALSYDGEDGRLQEVDTLIKDRLDDKIIDRGIFVTAQHLIDSYPRTRPTNWGVFFRAVCLFYPHFVRIPRFLRRDEIIAIKEELSLDICTPLVGEFGNEFYDEASDFMILAFADDADAVAFRLRMSD